MQKRGITTFRSKFFVSQYRKISLENTSVYQKISGIEKFYASERGGYHVSPSKTCHTVPKNFVGTLRCFRKFRVSKNFMHQRGGGGITFLRRKLVTQYRKVSLEHFGVSENFVYRKIFCIRRGYH